MIRTIDYSTDDLLALCLDRNLSDAPAVASDTWNREVDEIEKLIYGDEPPPEMDYSYDESVDLEAELDALEAEMFGEKDRQR